MALEMLASSPHGTTEELLVHGYGFAQRGAVRSRQRWLATARRDVIKAGVKTIEVNRIMITDAGRRALKG